MIDTTQARIDSVKARFKKMEIGSNAPKWSSWVLDQLFEGVVSNPEGSLQDLYVGLDAELRDESVLLTDEVANLIKDTVVKGFTRYKEDYRACNWDWVNQELEKDASPARCYLFLHALPPDYGTPESIVKILKVLQGTRYGKEALNVLSDDLNKAAVQRLLLSENGATANAVPQLLKANPKETGPSD